MAKKRLMLDPFGGLAGDMLLGALIDLGAAEDALRAGLGSLGLEGWTLEAGPEKRRNIGCMRARFGVPHEHHHRHLRDIEAIVAGSSLPPAVRDRARRIFARLAEAEGRVHRVAPEEVHFHEVGAMDAILDICGVSLALELLEVGEILCGPLPAGTGTIRSAHGEMPCPAPAVVELLGEFTLLAGVGAGEMVTPTGAAVLAELGRPLPLGLEYRPLGAGYGAGTREASVLRAVLAAAEDGEEAEAAAFSRDEVVVLEANLDDCPAEALGYLMERLFELGALDVTYAPVVMKKSRPGTALSCMVPPELADAAAELIFSESTTLGLRRQRVGRMVRARELLAVETELGEARVKVAGGRVFPEYEDCARIARVRGLPLSAVYDAVAAAFREREPGHGR